MVLATSPRMVVGAQIVKHVEKLSDEKTIQAIQENPYMQYLLGLEKFTDDGNEHLCYHRYSLYRLSNRQ